MTYDDIITDERRDVISSLKMAVVALELKENDASYWKWIILTLHSALQGAMVCHLSNTADLGACTESSETRWLKWHDGGRIGDEPNLRLEVPEVLFCWISDVGRHGTNTTHGHIAISPSEEAAFKLLHRLRNPFTHFQPMSWIIEIDGLPKMIGHIIDLIYKIYNTGWAFRHLDDEQKISLEKLIHSIKAKVV